jgi:hypothetical protein
MSRFQRPQFVAPVLPKPPKVFGLVNTVVAVPAKLKDAVIKARKPKLVVGAFSTVAAAAALKRAYESKAAHASAKARMEQADVVPILPAALAATPQAVQDHLRVVREYEAAAKGVFDQKSSVDEFGKPRR